MQNAKDILQKIKSFGLTLPDVAKLLLVSDSTVYRWFWGHTTPRVNYFFKLMAIEKKQAKGGRNVPDV